jgi:CRISPR-associated exonuclease Cas4
VYYTYCLPLIRPMTFKMEAGAQAHDAAPDLERRRSLKAYRLQAGEREFDVWLESAALGLRGRVDMVITRPGEIVPVEYKDSPGRGGPGWTLQLAAYGVMLEEACNASGAVSRGFVYYIPQRRAREFALTPEIKAQVAVTLQMMRDMIEFERMPGPAGQHAKCAACEFRRFCNDV